MYMCICACMCISVNRYTCVDMWIDKDLYVHAILTDICVTGLVLLGNVNFIH